MFPLRVHDGEQGNVWQRAPGFCPTMYGRNITKPKLLHKQCGSTHSKKNPSLEVSKLLKMEDKKWSDFLALHKQKIRSKSLILGVFCLFAYMLRKKICQFIIFNFRQLRHLL